MHTGLGPNRTDEERLSSMVEAHQLALLRLCCAYLHDPALAEDAVQETFLKAYRALPQYREEAGEKTWLSRIAINVCRDMHRTGWFRHIDRSVALDALPEPAVELQPGDHDLTLAVMRLPIRLRECVLLYYFEDMNTVEIAQTLHISQQAVSSRLKRAREKLRLSLEGGARDE